MPPTIHHEVDFPARPDRIYHALTDGKTFAAFTAHGDATIDNKPGGAISLFGGFISGCNVELVPGQRVVQAWRALDWEPGVFSIARFELTRQGAGTKITFDHTGFPDARRDDLDAGWRKMYWEPLKKYLS